MSSPTAALALSPGKPQGEVRFLYRGPEGLAAEKTLSFRHGSYAGGLRVRVEGAQGPIGIALGPEAGGSDGNTYGGVIEGPMSYVGKKLLYDAPEAGKPVAHKADVRWTALQSKHFLAALVPRGGTQGAETHLLREKEGRAKEYAVVVPLAGGEARLDFYAGPKETERLAALKVNLEDALDYGMFAFISRPLMAVLRALYAVSGNWGVAIILLTVLVKIIFYPLTHLSMRNMKEMQKLQPRMEQLRTLYKDDRGKLNEQVMALYREHKVNPMMGCLPMVIQIPVFFGLYEALLVSIELRQAPFFGWVHDLSVQEPYHVYTILMGASMFLQQKMTPTPGDPTQAKMMMFMPVVFTGMFIYYPVPVGLVIYWLVNNVLSIAQQYYVNRSVRPPKLAEGS
ncbi:MAG: membrane protein insertase YidC [Candidatus Tectomicrobia bacterium]|nr:membrane protein insertase YidC [Candidatus Tectomicrobia bacterium]